MKKKETDLSNFIRDSIGNTQISFDSDHMKLWEKLGLIPKHLTDEFFENLEKSRTDYEKMIEFKKKHPNALPEEMMAVVFGVPRILSEKEGKQLKDDVLMRVELHDFMVINWDKLVEAVVPRKLYKDVEHEKNFGVSRIQSDPCVHLHDLLDKMLAFQIDENDYKAQGEIKNSKGLSVILEFEFRAKDQEEADSIVSSYKKMMLTKGIRAFLAYWKVANEKGGLNFDCSISEVMNLIASEDRKTYFTDKDRAEFWEITKSLSATKFKLEWPARPSAGRPRKSGKGLKIEWVEQPLIQIHGGEKEIGKECPIHVLATVLTPESAKRRFFPAIIVNQTLKLHPSDVYFAVVIQSRAAQLGRGEREISYDWKYAYAAANVEGTAKTNPRKAKAAVRKKLGNYREQKIIEKARDDASRVYITPSSQKKT